MDLGRQISTLEAALRELIREWERFFAGDRRVPPQHERDTFTRRLNLIVDRGRRAEDVFRLTQLQHRFATYVGMWERMLREREEGRGVAARAAATRAGMGGDAQAAASVDRGGDEDIYARYVSAKQELGQAVQVSREAFMNQVKGQQERLEQRFGRRVQLDVVVDGGRVKLAARAANPAADKE